MLDRLKHSTFIKGKTVVGAHVNILSDGKYDIRLVILKKKGSKVSIDNKVENIDSIEDLINAIPASTPICLSIDGKGVIHKKISGIDSDSDKDILNKVLPNASLEDFLLCRNKIDDNSCFASIVRNDITDGIFLQLKTKKRFLVSFNLGPFSINHVYSFLNEKREVIYAGNYELSVIDNRISEYKKTERNDLPTMYRLGDEEVFENMLIPFSNAFGYFMPTDIEKINEYIKEQQDDFSYRQMFVIGGWAIMILLFSILLINYLFFDHYNKKQSELSGQVEQNKNLLTQLDTLTKELELKENFIAKSDFLKSTKQSFFADRLASTIPQNILLTKMDIQPLLKKMKNGDAPVFQKQSVIIEGMTNSSIVFNDWIKELNKKSWISELEVLNYNRENSRSSGSFILEVIINGTAPTGNTKQE